MAKNAARSGETPVQRGNAGGQNSTVSKETEAQLTGAMIQDSAVKGNMRHSQR